MARIAQPLILLALAGSAAASEPDRSELEEELFGEPDRSELEEELFGEPAEPADPGRGGPGTDWREEAPSGAEPPAAPGQALGVLSRALDAASDRLEIGGDLFLRLEYRALAGDDLSRSTLVSPSTLDLFLDARPVDRVRTYVRARLFHDMTVAGPSELGPQDLTNPADAPGTAALGGGRPRTQVLLDQLWLKFDVDQRVFVTAGKQRIRWGTGRIWNPTDFLNPQRFDPLALFDPRLGVGLLKLHLPLEAQGVNLYAIANFEGAARLDRVGGAVRGEIVFGPTEWALSGALRQGEPLRFGADLSAGVGPFELRVEGALLHQVQDPFFGGRWSAAEPLELGELEVRYRDRDFIPQLVAGGDVTVSYGDRSQAILGLEYFFNDIGYDGAEFYPLLLIAPAATRQLADLGVDLSPFGFREPPGPLFQPLYLGRHYLAAFFLFPAPLGFEDHTVSLTGIANLSDRSAVARVDHSLRLFRFLSLRSYVNVHLGDRGELRFGLDIGGVPGALPNGLSLAPPAFELGFALNTLL